MSIIKINSYQKPEIKKPQDPLVKFLETIPKTVAYTENQISDDFVKKEYVLELIEIIIKACKPEEHSGFMMACRLIADNVRAMTSTIAVDAAKVEILVKIRGIDNKLAKIKDDWCTVILPEYLPTEDLFYNAFMKKAIRLKAQRQAYQNMLVGEPYDPHVFDEEEE